MDDDPLARIHGELEAAKAERNEGRRRAAPSVWFGLGAGTGWGWMPTRAPEYYINAKVKGSLFGGWPLLPEIGYQWTDHIAFALQGRLEYLPADIGFGRDISCPSLNEWAWAVLAVRICFLTAFSDVRAICSYSGPATWVPARRLPLRRQEP